MPIALEIFGAGEGAVVESFDPGREPFLTHAEVAAIVVHEMVHTFQEQLQGTPTYLSLYTEEGKATLLGLSLREGGADFAKIGVSENWGQSINTVLYLYSDPNITSSSSS